MSQAPSLTQAAHQGRNRHPDFDQLLTERLGNYVYLLIDPRDRAPFHVGKGGGKTHAGNQRVLDHFKEARQTDPAQADRSDKIARIHDIWKQSQDVEWTIIRYGLENEAAAFEVECALMDALLLAGHDLTNATGGHGRSERGLIFGNEIYAHAAPLFDPQNVPDRLAGTPIFLFPVHNQAVRLLKDGVSGEDRFRIATSGNWSINVANRKIETLAIGISGGVSRGVYLARDWTEVPKNGKKGRLWRFEPVNPEPDVLEALLQKCFKNVLFEASFGFWQRGNPVAFKVRAGGQIEITVGKSKEHQTVGSLFVEEPHSMGLRGDRGLWNELGEKLAADPLPRTRSKLGELLCDAYRESTTQDISNPHEIAIPRFNNGGMSGGMISPRFWEERGIPLLLERYDDIRKKRRS